jgi:hypothetical protein
MKSMFKALGSCVLAIALTLAVGANARADVTYTYTGNPFPPLRVDFFLSLASASMIASLR